MFSLKVLPLIEMLQEIPNQVFWEQTWEQEKI